MTPEEYADLKAAIAVELFEQGYNCCQSVILAFAPETGLDEEGLKALACGFGGGMGRLREVCGAFSGMVMMAGFICRASDPAGSVVRTPVYSLVQELAAAFKAENGGSIICGDLLGLSRKGVAESPVPAQRDAAYYEKRPCRQIVRNSARTLAKAICSRKDQ